MKLIEPPPASYAFAYETTPRSGNEINGLGDELPRRATPVFHGSGRQQLEWSALDRFFVTINCWTNVWHNLRNFWHLRNADGPIAATRLTVDDAAAMAADVKQRALQSGAGIVGITEMTETAVLDGSSATYRYAISIGVPMDQDEMRYVPQKRAGIAVMRSYVAGTKAVVGLAQHIRSLGWPARAYGLNCNDILQLPLAVRAGLGQLGKHGSLITTEYGSNLRLAAVLTDLPMAVDRPVDLGVEDLCTRCQRCRIDCPPDAIFDTKQMVRGERKWYVDFDKCVPYFTKTYGCGICLEVCPWSESGRGPWLSETLLSKRDRSAGTSNQN
jgi:epoxyqueuosine reductase